MIQIIGYMIAAYGVARLAQTSKFGSDTSDSLAGAIGIGVLVLLAILLTSQANTVSGL